MVVPSFPFTSHKNVQNDEAKGQLLVHGLATTNRISCRRRRHHRHGKKPVQSTNRFFRAERDVATTAAIS